ncbi:hypothetical protein VM1G_11907 [Cytospora mali]|uniref:Uncharacterized protein n=1 Tax=Cytospora mali TaxID=578113 RepID=A0A194W9E2_CYTMA|nr:hypothetical protein VM1G_11907 [Valsa mali]
MATARLKFVDAGSTQWATVRKRRVGLEASDTGSLELRGTKWNRLDFFLCHLSPSSDNNNNINPPAFHDNQ